MVPVVGRTGEGMERLLETIIEVYNDVQPNVRHVHVSLGADMETSVRRLIDELKQAPGIERRFSPRYVAIKLLEGDKEAERQIAGSDSRDEILNLRDNLRDELTALHDEDVPSQVASSKYGFIAGALAETMQRTPVDNREATRLVDSVVTNKLLGFPILNGFIKIVIRRLERLSIARDAIIAGTLQPNPMISGMKDLPCRPMRCITLSIMKAALAI